MGTIKTTVGIGFLATLISGCSPIATSFQGISNDNKSQSSNGAGDAVNKLSCLDNRVDYELSTEVTDFEMVGGGGLNAGFSPTGLALLGLSVGVNYTQGQLQTMMHLRDPLKPGVTVVDAPGHAAQNNMSFSLNANLTMASFGPSFWYSTAISTLSKNALQNNLGAVTSQLNSLTQNDWWTTVSQLDGSRGFFIPVGATAGIQVGDEFKVMDATYVWAGNGVPCQNELIMPLVNSSTPKAIAKAQSVGLDYTYLAIEKLNASIDVHDYVDVSALVQPPKVSCSGFLGLGCSQSQAGRAPLAHSIRLGAISSKAMPYVGADGKLQYMDITPFVKNQLQSLLPQQDFGGFYVHP